MPNGQTADDAPAPRTPRILIVEDDFFVALEIEISLTEAGFQVVGTANTAEKAERLAADTRPDLIIMDIRLLSERDGIDAAHAIFASLGIRSVFATAHDDPDTQERAAGARPLGWIVKPYRMVALVSLVREAVRELGT